MDKALKVYRKRANLTQTEVAEKIGINQAAVCWWETGRSNPSSDKLPELTQLYSCIVDDLLRDTHAEEGQKHEAET